jgi:hypothetical protein
MGLARGVWAGEVDVDPFGPPPPEPAVEEDLRERLTEREDQRRPAEPWSTDVGGRPLTLSGEWEVELGRLWRADDPDRLLLGQTLEAEVFYSFGPELSLFAQMRVEMLEDLRSGTPDPLSELFVERGEMWVYSEGIAGTHWNLDLGRLDFEDDRRWWWDDELDAVRLGWETDRMEVVFAVARELAPTRTGSDRVDPEDDRVLRWLGEASWEWRRNNALELFVLHQDDHSPAERLGEVLAIDREDASDARLTWWGLRAMGGVELRSGGILGYWLDTAWVHGRERRAELEDVSSRRVRVEGIERRRVRGWAFDAGATWILPLSWDPRIFAGYAFGSGDPDEGGTDRAFRQTGLQANEAGFGGVERFPSYGVLLEPELSNLGVLTVGVGLSLLRSSSLDLVYHAYRLDEPATSLRGDALDLELTGADRDLGQAVDLVLALEEWERLEFELIGSAFRAGDAFGEGRGRWTWGAFVAGRFAF